jgi:hypothetical protein
MLTVLVCLMVASKLHAYTRLFPVVEAVLGRCLCIIGYCGGTCLLYARPCMLLYAACSPHAVPGIERLTPVGCAAHSMTAGCEWLLSKPFIDDVYIFLSSRAFGPHSIRGQHTSCPSLFTHGAWWYVYF